MELGPVARTAVRLQHRLERDLHRQQQLDSARSPADDGNSCGEERASTRRRSASQCSRKRSIGLTGNGVVASARHRDIRRRSDIDRQQIEGHRRPITADDAPPGRSSPIDFIETGTRAGEPREPLQIDMRVLERVMPRDEPRQHARVRRLDPARNQRQPDARHRAHAELPQDRDMAVPTAQQDQIFQSGKFKHSEVQSTLTRAMLRFERLTGRGRSRSQSGRAASRPHAGCWCTNTGSTSNREANWRKRLGVELQPFRRLRSGRSFQFR